MDKGSNATHLTGLIVAAVIVAAGLLFWQIKTRRERSAAEELADAFKISFANVASPIPQHSWICLHIRRREEPARL
jgi:hypothetical protein